MAELTPPLDELNPPTKQPWSPREEVSPKKNNLFSWGLLVLMTIIGMFLFWFFVFFKSEDTRFSLNRARDSIIASFNSARALNKGTILPASTNINTLWIPKLRTKEPTTNETNSTQSKLYNEETNKSVLSPETEIDGNWPADIPSLKNASQTVSQFCRGIMANVYSIQEKAQIRLKVRQWIIDYCVVLEKAGPKPLTQVPWGTPSDWKIFAHDTTHALAMYLLSTLDETEPQTYSRNTTACKVINWIIESPTKCFNTDRTKPEDIIRMAGPWAIACLVFYKNDSTILRSSPEYRTAVESAGLPTPIGYTDQGLHLDKSYQENFGQIYTPFLEMIGLYSDYWYELDSTLSTSNPKTIWTQKIAPILCHPTLSKGFPGFFTGNKTISAPTHIDSPLGLRCMPLSRTLRFFQQNTSFTVRGQVGHLSYYQTDKVNMDMGQYWTQFRECITATTQNVSGVNEFPRGGFFYPEGSTSLFVHNSPETRFNPTVIDELSFVFVYQNKAFFMQKYRAPAHSKYIIAESIYISDVVVQGQVTISNDLTTPNMEETRNFVYRNPSVSGGMIDVLVTPQGGPKMLTYAHHMGIGSSSGQVNTTNDLANATSIWDYGTYGSPGIRIQKIEKADNPSAGTDYDCAVFVLFDAGFPVMALPYQLTRIVPEFTVTIDEVPFRFVFNESINQYTSIEQR